MIIGTDRESIEIESIIQDYYNTVAEGFTIESVKIHPNTSRLTGIGVREEPLGESADKSDLDVIVTYRGNKTEDEVYDFLMEEELRVDGIPIDVIPKKGVSL